MDFCEQRQRFRARVGDRRAEALIIAGSRQTDTAALLVDALQPARLAFLLTPETSAFPDRVADQLQIARDPAWLVESASYTDVNQVYRALRNVIQQWPDLPRDQILVDLTGGTKLMTVGLAKAAYVLDLRAIYIESDYEQNRVIPGSQRLIEPSDPYEVFGDLEAEEAARLFNHHDYVSARRIYADLARRVPEPDRAHYHRLSQLAQAYAQWDGFDLQTAAQTMQRLLAQPLPEPIAAWQATLQFQQAALARLAGARHDDLTALADIDTVLPLLGSLHANALRREAQQRYDTAAFLRYRCLELIGQHRLATHGIRADDPDLDALKRRIPDLEQAYRQVERAMGFRERGLQPNRDGNYNPITLLNGYMLLKALADLLMETINPAQIRQRVHVRNKSILAHGFRQITEAEYRQFVELIEQILDRLFAVSERNRRDWEQRYRFIQL